MKYAVIPPHLAILAFVAAVALLSGSCRHRDNVGVSDSFSPQTEVLRSELKRGLAVQDRKAIDSLAACLYQYGLKTQDPKVLLYGMVAKTQSFYIHTDQSDSMKKYQALAETQARQENDYWALATLYNIKGAYEAFAEMDYEKGIRTLIEGIGYAKRCDDSSRLFPLESNLALAYYMHRDEAGLPYALDVYRFGVEENEPFARYLGAVLSAYMYEMMGQHTNAELYIDKVLDQVPYYGDQRGVYALAGDILSAKGEKTEAVRYYRKALSEGDDAGRFSDIDAHVGYASYLGQNGKIDSAITLLNQALRISQHANRPSKTYLLYHQLASFYEKSGHYRQALDCYKLYHEESDSLFNMEEERAVNDLKMKYERERYENELSKHKIEELQWKHKFIATLLFAAFVLTFIVCWCVHYNRKNKQYVQMLKRFQEQLEKDKAYQRTLEEPERQLKPKRCDDGNIQDEKMRDLFERLQHLMQEQQVYRNPDISRESVARLLQTNRTYLTDVIQRYTGLSFVHYVNSYRIEEAASILSDPNDNTPIKAIVSALGFSSLSTFYRMFQTIKGTSPSQYRKQNGG